MNRTNWNHDDIGDLLSNVSGGMSQDGFPQMNIMDITVLNIAVLVFVLCLECFIQSENLFRGQFPDI